jgi:cation transport regulator ChaC
VALGYGEPLFVPTPAVQATIACIADPEFHEFMQTADKNAFADQDEEGVHAPLLLSTLDLSHWTALMNAATVDPKLGMSRLRQAHEVLHVLLDRDEQDLAEAERNTRAVEAYLRVTNPHESWTKDEIPIPTVNLNSGSSGTSTVNVHSLLSRLNIAPAHKSAIEDLSESIQNTQAEATRASLEASGRGSAIPFIPPRALEEQLASRSHRTWCVSNINLLAPISIPMWQLWASLSDAEVKASEDRALNRVGLLKDPIMIPNAFPFGNV